jgi:hypothetical protein
MVKKATRCRPSSPSLLCDEIRAGDTPFSKKRKVFLRGTRWARVARAIKAADGPQQAMANAHNRHLVHLAAGWRETVARGAQGGLPAATTLRRLDLGAVSPLVMAVDSHGEALHEPPNSGVHRRL